MVSAIQKTKIVNMVELVENPKLLKHIELLLNKELQLDSKVNKSDALQQLMLQQMAKPMRKSITVEQLKKEQNYQPFSKKGSEKMVEDLDIQEPIEDLMKMLTK